MSEASSWQAPQAPVADYRTSPKPVQESVSAPEPIDPKLGRPILTVPGMKPNVSPIPEPDRTIETKQYSDGSSATGVAPLPDHSPEQQANQEAAKPSVADLDATAEEDKAKEATAAKVDEATAAE